MNSDIALFPRLLGEQWPRLATPVRQMHGDAPRVLARGMADVEGASHLVARLLRRLLGVPAPGTQQPLQITIERRGTREVWTRHFARGRMLSVLDRARDPALLRERLGPVALFFELKRDDGSIDWQLRKAHLLGLPLPRALFGEVLSRSGAADGRYTFHIDTRLPLVGRLVAYRGWLEIVDGD